MHCCGMQGDRHSENAFMAEDGYLKLIDTRDSHLAVDVRILCWTAALRCTLRSLRHAGLRGRASARRARVPLHPPMYSQLPDDGFSHLT